MLDAIDYHQREELSHERSLGIEQARRRRTFLKTLVW